MQRSSLKRNLLLIITIIVALTLAAVVVIQHFTNHFALAVILALVLGFIVGILLGSLYADSLTSRVQQLKLAVLRIRQGDLSQDIALLSRDEIGGLEEVMAGAVNDYRDTIAEMKQVSFQISRFDHRLSRLIKKVVTNNEGIDRLTQGIARGSEKQAMLIKQTANGLGLGLNEVDNLVRRAGQTVKKIEDARSQAARGEADARHTLAQLEQALEQMVSYTQPMYRLARKVEKMKTVTDVMNEISRKTDLLSLNASIEATRAGELGRGFALVADEIRNMAVNSKQSAQQIAGTVESLLEDNRLITDSLQQSQNAVGAGRESIHAIVTTFNEMLSAVRTIAGQVTDIEAVTHNSANQIRTLMEHVKELSILVEVNLASSRNTTRATENQKQDMLKIDKAMGDLQELSETMLQSQQRFQPHGLPDLDPADAPAAPSEPKAE